MLEILRPGAHLPESAFEPDPRGVLSTFEFEACAPAPSQSLRRGSHLKTRRFLACPWPLSRVCRFPQTLPHPLVASPFPRTEGFTQPPGVAKENPEAAKAAGKGEQLGLGLSRCSPGPLGQTDGPELPSGSQPGSANCTGAREGAWAHPCSPPPPLPFSREQQTFSECLTSKHPNIAPMAARDFMAIFISPASRLHRDAVGILQQLPQHCRGTALNLESKQVSEGGREKVWTSGAVQPMGEAWQMCEQ